MGKCGKYIYANDLKLKFILCALYFNVSIGESVFVCVGYVCNCIEHFRYCTVNACGVGRVKTFIGGWILRENFGENGKISATVDRIFLQRFMCIVTRKRVYVYLKNKK